LPLTAPLNAGVGPRNSSSFPIEIPDHHHQHIGDSQRDQKREIKDKRITEVVSDYLLDHLFTDNTRRGGKPGTTYTIEIRWQ
jgi:hypothetical protein